MSKGNVGAYSVADPKFDNYYVVMWDAEPECAEEDTEIELEGQKFPVSKGDWYCRGVWLDKLHGAKGWWTLTDRSCIVRLETIMNANVRVLEQNEENTLPTGLNKVVLAQAEEHGT